MAVYYTSMTAGFLPCVGGQVALRSAVDATTGISGQLLHPMTIIEFHELHCRCCMLFRRIKEDPGFDRLPGLLLIGAGVVVLNQPVAPLENF